jgi:hypothetical protein
MAIQMTRAEYEAKYGTKPVVQPITKAPVKMTRAQYEATYGKPAPVSAVAPVPVEKTFGQKVSGGIQKIFPGQKVGQAIGTLAGYALTPKENRKYYDTSAPSVGQVLGDAAQIALTIGTAGGVRTGVKGVSALGKASGVGSNLLNKATIETAKTVGGRALQNTAIGAGFGATTGIKEGKDVKGVLKDTAMGAAFGLGTGLAIDGAIGAYGAVKKTPTEKIDNYLKKAFQGTTGEVEKLDKMAVGAKRGLERLSNELPNIKIADSKAPIGSGVTKQFNPKKASGNDWLSAVAKQRDDVAEIGRSAAENASRQGIKIDTTPAKALVMNAMKTGKIGKSAGQQLLNQLDNVDGDPLKLHQWIQDQVNIRHFKVSGDLKSSQIATVANDAGEIMRETLDTIVDRKGYAQAYGDNRDLYRLLISAAKKANRNIPFGDITSEAGLDAAISILTSNPAYMARTLASGIFKGVVGKVRNNRGLNAIRNATNTISKIPNETKMPSPFPKPQPPQPAGPFMPPAPKPGQPRIQQVSGRVINLPKRTQSAVDAQSLANLTAQKIAPPSKIPSKVSISKSVAPTNVKNNIPVDTRSLDNSLEAVKKEYSKKLREISPNQPESWYKSQLENQPFVKNPEKYGFKEIAVTPTKLPSKGKTDSLTQEAKKYKSAEEFQNSIKEKFIKEQGFEPSSMKVVDEWYQAKQTQPFIGIGGQNPEFFANRPTVADLPKSDVSKYLKFTPDGKAIYYRGINKDVKTRSIRWGDFISPDKGKASMYGKVERYELDPKFVKQLGDLEAVYFNPADKLNAPTPISLTEIWKKANKNNADDALINEAKKYKSAEDFVKAQGKTATGAKIPDTLKSYLVEDVDLGQIYRQSGIKSSAYPADFVATKDIPQLKIKKGDKVSILANDKDAKRFTIENILERKTESGSYSKSAQVGDLVDGYSRQDQIDFINKNFSKNSLTKSQLTDIWNKANKFKRK